MSIPALVPEQDRAPSLASRVVTIHATDVTEGAPAPDSVTFALPCALRVPGDDVILRPGGVRVRLVDGRAQVRLPVYGGGAVRVDGSDDWLIKVSPSWGGEYGIRVPAGSGEVSLADLPAVRPLTRREKSYAITGVGVTVTEGAHAGGTAEYRNGQLDFEIQVPSFRPETVYPYIDETADARAQHYEQRVRADLDDRLAEVTTAYELAVGQGYEGTLDEWLDSLVGPKGEQGDDSTVPGPPNVLTIGDVVTGAAGSEASATISGTSPEQVLGFTIPRGDKGERGPAGNVNIEKPAEGVWDFQPEGLVVEVGDVTGLAARLAALEYQSGSRNITARMSVQPTTGAFYIERIGDVVWANLSGIRMPESGDFVLLGGLIPEGFRPRRIQDFGTANRSNTDPVSSLRVDLSGTVYFYGVDSAHHIRGAVSWPTRDAPPIVLPGEPA